VVESPDAARRAVRELAQSDVDCVKVYNGVSAEIFDAIRDAAATAGLRTVAHVPWEVPFERIREAEVQHLMGLEGHSWRVPERRLQRYVEASRAHGISHTPTLVAFARAAQLEDYAALRDSPVALLLPRYYRELLWNPEENPLVFEFSPASGSGVEDRLGTMQEVVRRLHAAEVPVLAGTDTMNPFVVPGAGLQEELGHLADAGLSLEEAWTAATRRAGGALGVADLGVLRTGAPADFLIFDEDPSRDLAALATLRAVVAAGRLYPVAMLEEAADRQRARLENAAYETVANWAARLGLAWIAAEEG
jgi:cytosine/adenosine deaminase-related metal-dependent hydrolase